MKRVKLILVSSFLLIFSFPVFANDKPMINEGTRELILQGDIDFASAVGTDVNLNAAYGYFVADGLQVGGILGFNDNDFLTTWILGGQLEYNIDTGSKFVPYFGARTGWVSVDPDQGSSDDGWLVGGSAGVKYFFVPNIAISLSYLLEWASEDVYFDDQKPEDTNHSIQLGMRFYF